MKKNKRKLIALIAFLLFFSYSSQTCLAIEEQTDTQTKKAKFSWFKKDPLKPQKEIKKNKRKSKVENIKLPEVLEGKPKVSFEKLSALTIDDCVNYAIQHNPNLMVSSERIKAANSKIGQARANYAPRLTSAVNYNHQETKIPKLHTENDQGAFSAGVSQTIWDFGQTTARIKMEKFNTLATQYDYDYDILNVIYGVKINYYNVLAALAHLDIYEQNVRIQKLNYTRTNAMFEEGLKSKIDVVNAQVNLTDSEIQLVEGRKNLQTAIINLKNSMYYQEDEPFIVQNTENFGFLKTDYRKKIESLTTPKTPDVIAKKNKDGLIMLSSGIEHNDIIQNFEFIPMTLTKKEAVDKALDLRPDLKSIDMITQVQEEALKTIRRQYLPSVQGNLQFSHGRAENNMYNTGLTAGASISFGTINPMAIHFQLKEGRSLLDIAYHNLNIAKTDIFWEVQTNYVNMRQLEKKIPLMNEKVKATLENFELADGRYSVGLNNYVELQDALTNYNNAQLNFVEAVFNYNVARETLLKSMGVK